jgi:GTP-binding protein
LIENMRREGFELTIGRPRVVLREEGGQKLEPIEEVIIDVDDEHSGIVVQKLTERKGDLVDMRPSGIGRTRLRFYVPTRSLIGYQPELLSDTRGTAIFNRLFHEYQPFKGALPGRRTGVLISNSNGTSVAFALWNLEERGPMMIDAGVDVYEGMIIGEHSRDNDLEVNPVKGKQLTNIRTHSKDEAVRLTTPKKLTLEQSLGYIADDEYVEVTPKSIRLRKIWLDPNDRKKMMRATKAAS